MRKIAVVLSLSLVSTVFGQNLEAKPDDPYFAKFKIPVAPQRQPARGSTVNGSAPMVIPEQARADLRVAICGDSITEQKMYSRIIETYLTVCTPELNASVRQFGWSGEQAPGFLARMSDDVLRFRPMVATTCYGMNDHGYRPYEQSIGDRYRGYQADIIHLFKQAGTYVVLGSPGCIGKLPTWTGSANYTVEQLNLNLYELRNIDIELAKAENTGFADVFWPMFKANYEARKKYGEEYAVAGKDGVHPNWAGQLVMAHAFLKGMGMDGEIGTFTIDMKLRQANLSEGHQRL
ncbi:MAG TPA: SGNH/GDSL hydrolase family protein, partial [Verrucomicrobiae bacterium]|nr:SGNH/GDSL hydrolase family protein [Verrucomicrobiae bacterium]